uniref:NAD(P)(+)--arginine ADP-ribosyltransferase n=1 Tax=Xenopus tropicalis TaxID=8364 RepID=A0A1B8Y4J4_XENTR
MEKHMFLVLKKEKLNREFGSAWDNATEKWEEIEPTLELPDEFRDEYGIALLVYTNDYPEGNPIFRQLNNNVSAAGVSRDHYMREFHFKALHFYLTRALQLLKPDCNGTLTAYRGSDATYSLSSLFHFHQFTSSSLDKTVALRFGMGSVFRIETCFGASIRDFSFFPAEAEVLIPVTEQFRFVKQVKSLYVVESTGVQCSYFNCAYLGADKQTQRNCHLGMDTEGNESGSERRQCEGQEERIAAIEEVMGANQQRWGDSEKQMDALEIDAHISAKEFDTKIDTLTKVMFVLFLQSNYSTEISALQEEIARVQEMSQAGLLISRGLRDYKLPELVQRLSDFKKETAQTMGTHSAGISSLENKLYYIIDLYMESSKRHVTMNQRAGL